MLIESPEDDVILVSNIQGSRLNSVDEGVVSDAARSMVIHALKFQDTYVRTIRGSFVDKNILRLALVDGDGKLGIYDYNLVDKEMNKKEIEEDLKPLNSGKFHAECPNCMDEVNLKEAGLFHLDHFTAEAKEVYKEMIDFQKERRAELKERRLKIPLKSEVGAKSVNLGFLLERLAPTLEGFKFNKNDCR